MVANINRFFDDNFVLLFAFALIWTVVCVAIMLWRRSSRGPDFPSVDSVNVMFRERFASGASHRSIVTRLGGAQNCLTIILTEDELWITTFFPFTAFVGFYDLEHRIPIGCITELQRDGKKFTIDFVNYNAEPGRIALRLRRAEQFVDAIERVAPTVGQS